MDKQAVRSTTAVDDPSSVVVEVRSLTKVFKDFWRRPKVKAVNDLSFSIRQGEVFGLLGPNGSGKSTTLKLALGLLHPTQGVVRVLNKAPRHVRTKARIGYLPEDSCLYPYLSAEEALNFYGRLFDLSGKERKQRIAQLLEMTGLLHARNRLVGEYSKGMSRRIGLAQALINDPELVVLDEPTAGLDPMGCRQVKDLIRTLADRGKTVLLSSHLLADVEDVCDRVAILYSGQIRAIGAIHDLLSDKSQCTLTLPELPPRELKRVLSNIREVIGQEPAISYPQQELEAFFIQVVNQARLQTKENAGSAISSDGVAAYLQATEGERAQPLCAAESPSQDSSMPDHTKADDFLRHLTKNRKTGDTD